MSYFHKTPQKEYNRRSPAYFEHKHYISQSLATRYLWTPLAILIGMIVFWYFLNFLHAIGQRNVGANQIQTPPTPTQEMQRSN